MRRPAMLLLGLLAAGHALASESVSFRFIFGCAAEAPAVYSDANLAWVGGRLARANTSEKEREALAEAVAKLYAWAGEQTPVARDRAGNVADGGEPGQMDCIDHSTTTTRLLRMMERRGWLRFHRVLDPVRRLTLMVVQHYSAAIEDLGDGVSVVRSDVGGRTWAVDSWYADNGKPPWIVTLEQWEKDYAFGL